MTHISFRRSLDPQIPIQNAKLEKLNLTHLPQTFGHVQQKARSGEEGRLSSHDALSGVYQNSLDYSASGSKISPSSSVNPGNSRIRRYR